jgi:integrase
MPRKASWPPKVYVDRKGYARTRIWKNGRCSEFRLGKAGTPEAKGKYLRIIARAEANGGEVVPDAGGDVTVSEVLARYLVYANERYDPAGREPENYALSFRALRQLYGSSLATDFDAAALEVVQLAMASGSWMNEEERKALTDRKKPLGWCRNVVNQRVNRIRTCWRWAERQKLVPKGSHQHLCTLPGLPKNSRRVRHTAPRKPASREDVEAVAAKAHPRIAAMLRLEYLSGMRPGELRTMKMSELDRSNPDVWVYTPGRYKTQRLDNAPERRVYLGKESQAILQPWLREDDGYLFQPRPGKCYSDYGMSQAVSRACRRAGIKLVFYQTRHGCKQRVTREEGLDAARAMLGHLSLGTTNSYAAGQDEQLAIEVARKLG